MTTDKESSGLRSVPTKYWRVTLRKVQRIRESSLGSTTSEVHKVPTETVEVIAQGFDFRDGWIHFRGCRDGSDWGCNMKDFDEYEVEEYI